jgi:hypothetical protein
MSKFTNVLVVSPYADGKTWYLRSEFSYEKGSVGSGNTITAPVGFTTDFASIPRIFWAILSPWGKYGNAAVIHDWLYFDQTRTKSEADNILFEAMGVLEVPTWQKYVIYWGVKFGGFIAWYMDSQKKKAGYSKVVSYAPLKATDKADHWKLPFFRTIQIMFGAFKEVKKEVEGKN